VSLPNPADMMGGFINNVNKFVTENWLLIVIVGGTIVILGYMLMLGSLFGVVK